MDRARYPDARRALAVLGLTFAGACRGLVLDPDHVIALEIPTPPSSIVVGDTVRLSARALNAMGNPVPGVTIRWAVVDTGMVGFTLDESGLVTAIAPDTGRVQASVDDLRSDPILLRVVAGAPPAGASR